MTINAQRYIKNNTGSTVYYVGVPITAGSFYQIPPEKYTAYSNNDSLLADIASGDASISRDGVTVITGLSDQLNALKGFEPDTTLPGSLEISWTEFKSFMDTRNVPAHEATASNGDVILSSYDGPVSRWCQLDTGSADYTDYTTNYQSAANTSMTDSNGVALARTKVTQSGWFYQEHAIEITTADDQNFYNKDKDGNDLGFITYTMYDINDNVTTTDVLAVKTVITWEPTHDTEIIGYQMFQAIAPPTDVRMHVIAVPDYAAPTGSIPFVQGGINLKHLGTGNIMKVDGRSAKKMLYNDPIPGTNKFEMQLTHNAGVQVTMQILIEMFRP